MISKKFDWAGFKLGKNQLDSIKQGLYILVPTVLSWLALDNILGAAAIGYLGKSICSALEFYLKKKIIQGVTP